MNSVLPSLAAPDVQICETTEGYLCPMGQALYPVGGIEWCVCALYGQDTEGMGTYCAVITTFGHAGVAQGLDGYLWAVGSLGEEGMRVGCLEDGRLEDIGPPLVVVHIGNGCEGYSGSLFIPARSELVSEDGALTGHVFFLDFNNECQDLARYSLVQRLGLPQLTARGLEELPSQLMALQPMALDHLKG